MDGKQVSPSFLSITHFAMLNSHIHISPSHTQARRTKSSNALGMIFDHGCDAINAGVGATNLLVCLGLVSNYKEVWDPFLVLSALATPFVPFYVATWEEYYVGQLVLPIINGPSEGVLIGVAICKCVSIHPYFLYIPLTLSSSGYIDLSIHR